MEKAGLGSALRVGHVIFIILVVLAVAEYFLGIAVDSGNLAFMIIMNIVDAALILYYFMHFHQIWHPEK